MPLRTVLHIQAITITARHRNAKKRTAKDRSLLDPSRYHDPPQL